VGGPACVSGWRPTDLWAVLQSNCIYIILLYTIHICAVIVMIAS
jgi:hypothetical protein